MHMYIFKGEIPDVLVIKGSTIEGLNWTKGTRLFCRSAVVPIREGAKRFEAELTD